VHDVSERQVTSPTGFAAVIRLSTDGDLPVDGGSPAKSRNEIVPFGAPPELTARVYCNSSSDRLPLLITILSNPKEAEYSEFGAVGLKYLREKG
jgi:hypothetical protein